MIRKKDVYKVGISGSYGGFNIGDEAILHVMIRELKNVLPVEITVFSKNVEHTRQQHPVEKVVPVRKLAKNEIVQELGDQDLFILGGGGILYDRDTEIYLREADIAVSKKIPTMVCAVGAGPLETFDAKLAIKAVLNKVQAITVRDSWTKILLQRAGVEKDIIVTADPAFLIEPEEFTDEMLQQEAVPLDKHIVGFSVREPGPAAPDLTTTEYHTLLANAADFVIERLDANVLFIPMEWYDLQHSHAIISKMKRIKRAFILRGEYAPTQIAGLMKRLDLAVGMRLHFLTLAAIAYTPIVPLPYAEKVEGFLELLEMPSMGIEKLGIGQLLAFIDRDWDLRNELREKLKKKLPEIQERAKINTKIAYSLLTEYHDVG